MNYSQATTDINAQLLEQQQHLNLDDDVEMRKVKHAPGVQIMQKRQHHQSKRQQHYHHKQQQLQEKINTELMLWSISEARLHEELILFQSWAMPTPFEKAARTRLLRRLRTAIDEVWPMAKLLVFGSFRTRLYLPTSDLDLALIGDFPSLTKLSQVLRQFSNHVTVLDKATVPIVKFTDCSTGISVDISINTHTGVQAVGMITKCLSTYPCLGPLVLLLKQFLVARGLNSVWCGGISSYALTLMVVAFLQQRPHERQLGRLLLQFLYVYGIQFDYATTGIRVSTPASSHVPKSQLRVQMPGLLSIEDPLLPGNDIGRSSYGILQVKREFESAYHALRNAMSTGQWPLLTFIIGWPKRPHAPMCCCHCCSPNVAGCNQASDDSDQSDARPSSQ